MKKIHELLKPFLTTILGAVLLLYYLNFLAVEAPFLVIGIIGVSVSAIYLAMGILSIVLGDKLNETLKKIFFICQSVLFPAFFFSTELIILINYYQGFKPTSWTIYILSMVGSLGFIVFFILNQFMKNAVVKRLSFILALVFVLIMLLNILFEVDGSQVLLGDVPVVLVIIYVTFSWIIFNNAVLIKEETVEEVKE